MATSIIKRQIAKAVEAKIIETVEKADAKLTGSMMQHYQEALNKNASLDDLATRNAAMREQQQLQQPTQQQQQQQPMSPMEQVTSAVGYQGAQQQQQQRQAGTTAMPTTTMPRPSLTTGLFTILNRNIKTNMVRSLQDQQSKHRRRKAEKEAARKEREQQQAKEEEKTRGRGMGMGMGQIPSSGGAEGGAGTVPVIVGQDGKMYIANEQGRLVPVTLAGDNEPQQQQKKPSQKQKQRGKGPSLGKQGFNKVADEMGTGNQDIGQQQATAAAPNVM